METSGLDRALLDRLKRLEREEDALPLVGDLPAMRLVIVWDRVTIYKRSPEETADLRGRVLTPWRRLWLPFELDYNELAIAADIPTERFARQEAERAVALLWVYPDNTVNAHALRLAVDTYRSRMHKTSTYALAQRLAKLEKRLGSEA